MTNPCKKAEFHIHTSASQDSLQSRRTLLRQCKKHGIDCVAITDHNEVKFALKNADYFRKHGVEIIVGEEIFSSEGEIIGLFLTERIAPGQTALETVRAIRCQGGLVYVPHPYDEKRHKTVLRPEALKAIASEVDLIECHNGRNIDPSYSLRQAEIAKNYGLRGIVGSDAHTPMEIGRNYCLVSSFTREGLLEAIDQAQFVTAQCLSAAHKKTRWDRLRKMIRRGDIRGIIGVIKRKTHRDR